MSKKKQLNSKYGKGPSGEGAKRCFKQKNSRSWPWKKNLGEKNRGGERRTRRSRRTHSIKKGDVLLLGENGKCSDKGRLCPGRGNGLPEWGLKKKGSGGGPKKKNEGKEGLSHHKGGACKH